MTTLTLSETHQIFISRWVSCKPIDRVLFGSGVMMCVHKNGMNTSGHVSSTVNLIAQSMTCMCYRKLAIVFYLLYNKSVSHLPFPKSGWFLSYS